MSNASTSRAGSKKELWLRLRDYHFDHLVPPHLMDALRATFEGSDTYTQAFADKLARKLHWSRSFAMRAIGEYKKFLYLGLVADFPVTPPKVIDQVWHEHLLFSRGYREFCDQVLGREFDHHPELIPVDEQTARFQAQYDATLALYQTEFDSEPPAAFWGVPKCTVASGADMAKLRRSRGDGGASVASSNSGSDGPLHAQFGSSGGGSHGGMPEFGHGGSGGAGGGGGEWGGHGDGHAGADSTGSHGGGHGAGDGGGHGGGDGGGSDGGGGDGGGSGCSSGCGGCGSS
jgi:hypothetical protein